MKQRIVHGGQIETATPQEVSKLIAESFERQVIRQFERKKGVINLDGTGAGNVALSVPAQYDWIMERVTVSAVPAAAALIGLYENQADTVDLLEIIQLGTAGLYSDGFSNRLYVSANSQVIITCQSGPANGQATFNLQVQLQRRPARGVLA